MELTKRTDRPALALVPGIAGLAYVAVWIAGLAIWPSNTDVAASGSQVLAAYAGHQAQAMTQSLLVHGLAAVGLVVVSLALGSAARLRGARGWGRAAVVAGLAAAAISLAQFALGQLLGGWVAPSGDAGRALVVFDLISRLDGAKMLALAALAASGAALAFQGVLPRWLGYLGVLLAAALVTSGAGYLLLQRTLAQAAYVSGTLLLLWVGATGVALARLRR
jgi:hypothetical protein